MWQPKALYGDYKPDNNTDGYPHWMKKYKNEDGEYPTWFTAHMVNFEQYELSEIYTEEYMDKKQQKNVEKEKEREAQKLIRNKIKEIKKKKYNAKCADCSAKFPSWIITDYWIFTCTNCMTLHQNNLKHKCKNINLDDFTEFDVESLEQNGNKKSNRKYLANYDSDNDKSAKDEFTQFLTDKYENRKWMKLDYSDSNKKSKKKKKKKKRKDTNDNEDSKEKEQTNEPFGDFGDFDPFNADGDGGDNNDPFSNDNNDKAQVTENPFDDPFGFDDEVQNNDNNNGNDWTAFDEPADNQSKSDKKGKGNDGGDIFGDNNANMQNNNNNNNNTNTSNEWALF